MTTLTLTKHHGLGNDFLVALAAHNPGLHADPATARALCDRRRGIGADGLILGFGEAADVAGPGSGDDHVADARMVLLNSDGSDAAISGNGIRCLGQAVLRSQGRGEGSLTIDTPGGRHRLRVVRGDVDSEVFIEVDMGPAKPGPELSAASTTYPATRAATVELGNPHLVLEVDDPAAVDLAVDGPALESGYPDGINVHFVRVTAADRLELRVRERGAGVTEACGSGAVAAAVAAQGWGLVGPRVMVDMPGGSAIVETTDGTVLLTGPSTFVGEVVVP